MASTRNKNTRGNYCLDQGQNTGSEAWQLYTNGANGYAYETRLPGNGLNPAQIPWSKLSGNPADIESFLFGINSTNLVNPAPPLTPELKCLKTANVFKTAPVIMPIPQAIPKHQRPNILS
jgi:hypothetical protein